MGLAVSQITTLNIMDVKSNLELQLTYICNDLQTLARQSQSIIEQQTRMGNAYMSQHKDEEGQVDISAVEYVNSSAFTSTFQAQLKSVQVKEQSLTIRKTQLETRQKMYTTNEEGWEKNIDKSISSQFKYCQ